MCRQQVQQTHKVLEKPDAEWSAVSSTLGELADSIEALSSQQPMRDVSRQLLTIAVRVVVVHSLVH